MLASVLRRGWLAALVLVLVVAGRSPRAEEKKPDKDKGEVTLKAVKFVELQKAIASHKGKVVVVDVWASWCVPCKKEFPNLVELHKDYAAEGLVCISASMDDKDQAAAALAFLKQQKATFPNYRCADGEDWFDKFDLKSIPAVFVYDRKGKLARKFTLDDVDNQFDYRRDVVPLVRKLVKAK
jgi:thiol-disulfide isomerase/thioredoxin